MAYSTNVDADLCIGSGQCELFCPSVFEIRDNIAFVMLNEPPVELYDSVMDAADACPVQAITVTNGQA